MSNETVEASKVHTMQDIVGHVKFCLYPKSNRKSRKIFKQVIGRGGRKEMDIIRFAFWKDHTPQCEEETV